ncbi:MAG: thiamine-phosphate kinase [Rikenellaceae bacterium]|nr:thiamine-phosphate kinase [Rikenellaceae bacterium]
MNTDKRTEIATLGEFGLIDHLTEPFVARNASLVKGPGDDAAVIDTGADDYTLLSTDMLLEGVDFDLTYFPLKHLGYKAVVVGCSDIYAMNGHPTAITVSIGVSAKLSVEDLDDLYSGIRAACDDYGIDLAGGDTRASVTGLVISISTVGRVAKEKVTYRSGAQLHDLICITSDLGAAYLGLKLLEREKIALGGVPNAQPRFEGYEYLLRRQLKPVARREVIMELEAQGIVPTSMIDLSDGLASELLHVCRQSKCGARIYLERIPIAREVHTLAEELHIDPVTAALNGGDDHELMFTVPLAMQDKVMQFGYGVEVIGHITEESMGAALVTPDGSNIALKAQGFHGN